MKNSQDGESTFYRSSPINCFLDSVLDSRVLESYLHLQTVGMVFFPVSF